MGDAELMSTALLLDVSSYYTGLVRAVYRDPECAFLNLPFMGRGGRFARKVMRFYGQRLVTLGEPKMGDGLLRKKECWLARTLRRVRSRHTHSQTIFTRIPTMAEMRNHESRVDAAASCHSRRPGITWNACSRFSRNGFQRCWLFRGFVTLVAVFLPARPDVKAAGLTRQFP